MEKNKDLMALISRPSTSFVRADIEAHLLGSLLRSPSTTLPSITTFMLPEVFTDFFHKTVYQQLLSIDADKKKFSLNVIRARVDKALPMTAEQNALRIEELLQFESENYAADAEMLYDMYLSRSTIAFADRMRNELAAGGNPYELNQKFFEELKHITETSQVQTVKQKLEDQTLKCFIMEKPPLQPCLVTIDQTPVVRKNDHTLVIGKAKSRKSLFVTHLISQYYKSLGRNGGKQTGRVVLFDTEQDKEDVWRMRENVYKSCGATIDVLTLRGVSAKERRDVIEHLLSTRATYDIAVIDGIRDLLTDLLDSKETHELILWVERIMLYNNVAVINVLHVNKTDNNARGHIGTELMNKAVAAIRLEYDPKTTHTRVTCEAARRAPFEPYSFTHGPDGNYLHIGAAIETPEGTLTQTENVRRLETIFESGPMKYGELTKCVQTEFAVGRNKALQYIADFMRRGYMIKTGAFRDPNSVYKLVASAETAHKFQPPVEEEATTPTEIYATNDPDLPF